MLVIEAVCSLALEPHDHLHISHVRTLAPGQHALRYHGISRRPGMTDMLIRDVPDDVIAALDAHAGRLGLSRSEYVRRRLAQDAATQGSPVTVEDLARFTEVFGDMADEDVMSRAWHDDDLAD